MTDQFLFELNSLIIPDSNCIIAGASSYQSEVVAVSTADDIFFVAVLLPSEDILPGISVLLYLISVYLDHSVPSAGNNITVILSVSYEGDLSILWVMTIKLVDNHSREQIKHLNMSEVISDYKFPMTLVEVHACNVTIKYVL